MTEIEIQLRDRNLEILKTLDCVIELNKSLHLKNQKQQHQIDQLLRQLYGKNSEKLTAQPSLFDQSFFPEGEIGAVEPEQKETVIDEHKRKERKKDPKSLRYEFPNHLHREEVSIEPTEVPEVAVKIGEEVSEKLEMIRAELNVNRTVLPKYAMADKSGVVVAEFPEAPIYRCMAGVSLLVYLVIAKYVDHLPLYRTNEQFARQGVKMSDSTMGDWVSQVAKLLEILYKE